jgi:hypothetical protein
MKNICKTIVLLHGVAAHPVLSFARGISAYRNFYLVVFQFSGSCSSFSSAGLLPYQLAAASSAGLKLHLQFTTIIWPGALASGPQLHQLAYNIIR